MITMESWTKGIKFKRHKEESLISSQFLKNQKKSKTSPFLIVLFNKKLSPITMSALYVMKKNLLNIKTLNKGWFGLKLADPK